MGINVIDKQAWVFIEGLPPYAAQVEMPEVGPGEIIQLGERKEKVVQTRARITWEHTLESGKVIKE